VHDPRADTARGQLGARLLEALALLLHQRVLGMSAVAKCV
jgi:hypothetical protein